ncbi:tetratricopeptide repeat protein [Thermocrinis jamiesonii]|uniref:tetratricopeptide repeat protein n=1 Tax=Thermocrinis jamiesonii TaxID=1302351 RepID=UPI0004979222|nr:tetratricopeptide repeat protein [Thermocrinis jamiesonii]
MLKLIALFSLFTFLFGFSQIKKEFDLQVEIVAKELEEKPKLYPPEKLPLEESKVLDLSPKLLQPPKEMEFVPVLSIKEEGLSCGKPKDAIAYKKGVDHYLAGNFDQAEKELETILVMGSPYRPMAEYVLGLIKLRQGQKAQAKNLFENSCKYSHRYKKASCELYYALSFELEGTVPKNRDKFWSVVYEVSKGNYKVPSCEGVVFGKYCAYIGDFVKGEINTDYKDSTKIRKAIILFESGQLEKAKEILNEYSKPAKPYRDIALYYLGLIALQENDPQLAYRYASLLETINKDYAYSLYSSIASKGVLWARLTYGITKNKAFLNVAGILAYNNKDYQLAFSNFLEAKNLRYAVYSLIRKGDYKTAYKLLKEKKEKDREDYLWLLESAYWADIPVEDVLNSIKDKYVELYREYLGWSYFKKGDWSSALKYFDNPEHKALCYFNLKKYQEVLNILQKVSSRKANILKAKSALFLNNPSLARSFLSPNSDEELYLLGISFFMEEDYDRAIEYFSKVSKEGPFGPKAWMKIADALYNLGKVEEAKATYWNILRSFPDDPMASQAVLALLEVGTDLPDTKKEELIREYLTKNPNTPYAKELKYQLADILINRGEKKEAQKLLVELYEEGGDLKYKALLKLASIEEDKNNKAVLLYKVYKEGNTEESTQARKELIALYTQLGDMLSAAELLEGGDFQEKEKAIELYVKLSQWQKALNLSKELMKVGFRSQTFEANLMKIYQNIKDESLLDYLIESADIDTSAKAKLEKALTLKAMNRPKEALEYLVDISINHKGSSVYNFAIMEGVRLFLDLGLKKDASCFLERFDLKSSSEEERIKIEHLRESLPKCEVR